LLKTAYPAAKAGDPGTTVIGGVLSESDVPFTEALYANGIKGSFDAFSIHPYSHDWSPTRPITGSGVRSSFINGVPAVREVMVRNGDPKPMWLTEFGWSTSAVRGAEPWANGVSDAVQAQYLTEAFATMRSWDFVEVGIWFTSSTGARTRSAATRTSACCAATTPPSRRTRPSRPPPRSSEPRPRPRPPPRPRPRRPRRAPAPAPTSSGTTGKAAPKRSESTATAADTAVTAATDAPAPDATDTTTTAPATRAPSARAICSRGRLVIRGNAPEGSLVRVEAYRIATFRSASRAAARPALRRVVRAAGGRFEIRPARSALKGCAFRVLAKRAQAKRVV
jgi:hypothetical protein